MIFLGYFLDSVFVRFLVGTWFYPYFAFVFALFCYLKEKNFDSFLLKSGIQSFLAFLFFRRNFFLDFSYFVLFYTILNNLFSKRLSRKNLLVSIGCFLFGYYLYGGILYFLLQKPMLLSRWLWLLVSSLPFNLIITFLFSILFGLIEEKS